MRIRESRPGVIMAQETVMKTELEYTDFTQAMKDAGVITRKQHVDMNYYLRGRINQLNYREDQRIRELDKILDENHGQG